jgi:hypothetical protein
VTLTSAARLVYGAEFKGGSPPSGCEGAPDNRSLSPPPALQASERVPVLR